MKEVILALYNPHGSDGTWQNKQIIVFTFFFITHTVQMELIYLLNHMLSITPL